MRFFQNLKLKSDIVFLSMATILLFLGFQGNFYGVANEYSFHSFQQDTESYVIGKLILAQETGLFYKGGQIGLFLGEYKANHNSHYDIYLNELKPDKEGFWFYHSHPGANAAIFVLLDKISPFGKLWNLRIFWMISAFLSALAFSFFLLWAKQNFGLKAAIIVLILLIFSHWITIFGRNLFWALWSFYIPFLTFLFFTKNKIDNGREISFLQILIIAFLTLFLKFLFSGYEYITTTLIMAFTPVLFYWFYQNERIALLLKKGLAFSLGVAAFTSSSMFMLAFQISKVRGSLQKGFDYIISSYERRSNGDPTKYWDELVESLEASRIVVLEKYFQDKAFDFNFFFNTEWKNLLIIDFGELFMIFMIFTSLLFVVIEKLNTQDEKRRQYKALVITLWFSILAPISWHIVFKAHSYIHTHINFITWYMPFALFGFVVTGVVVSSFLNNIFDIVRKVSKSSFKESC